MALIDIPDKLTNDALSATEFNQLLDALKNGTREINTGGARTPGIIQFTTEYDNGDSSTADTIDFNNGQKQKSTLTGNCVFTFTAPSVGIGNFQLKLIQDATGSRTVTWPATVKWAGGTAPTLSTDPAAIDIISFYYDGTNYYGVGSIGFA